MIGHILEKLSGVKIQEPEKIVSKVNFS